MWEWIVIGLWGLSEKMKKAKIDKETLERHKQIWGESNKKPQNSQNNGD